MTLNLKKKVLINWNFSKIEKDKLINLKSRYSAVGQTSIFTSLLPPWLHKEPAGGVSLCLSLYLSSTATTRPVRVTPMQTVAGDMWWCDGVMVQTITITCPPHYTFITNTTSHHTPLHLSPSWKHENVDICIPICRDWNILETNTLLSPS